jgi:hypothetical protein
MEYNNDFLSSQMSAIDLLYNKSWEANNILDDAEYKFPRAVKYIGSDPRLKEISDKRMLVWINHHNKGLFSTSNLTDEMRKEIILPQNSTMFFHDKALIKEVIRKDNIKE